MAVGVGIFLVHANIHATIRAFNGSSKATEARSNNDHARQCHLEIIPRCEVMY